MSRNQIRAVLPSVYVIAILIAVFSHHGVAAVASIGAIALGMSYTLLKPDPGTGRDRQRRRRGSDTPTGNDVQDS